MTMTVLRRACLLLLISAFSSGQTDECEADGTCKAKDACQDFHDDCAEKASSGDCDKEKLLMYETCPMSCGVCFGSFGQTLGLARGEKERTLKNLTETLDYVNDFKNDENFKEQWDSCENSLKNSQCVFWASMGECQANPSYMSLSCAAACRTCDRFDIRVRCPMERATPNVWEPGDLNKFYVNLTTNANHDNEVKILSKPPEGPWVVVIDDFLSEQEANRLIELGAERGYERSFGNGGFDKHGTSIDLVSGSRTSSNTFCQGDCFEDPTATKIRMRIANLTSTPPGNHEHLQLLHYDVGQFYYTHHDFIPYHVDRQPGPRIITVFLYLNDVEAGGGTNFPKLGLEVSPKLGRALIWSHVFDEFPEKKDARTDHEALPVEKGEKYAANAWIHQREYIAAHGDNCQ